MATPDLRSLRAHREAVVNAHIEAEAVQHDVSAALATFDHPRYEIPSLETIADGAEAVEGLLTQFLRSFPDFWLEKLALHHADDAVVVECRFGGTQRELWAGIPPTQKRMQVESALIFVFEGEKLVCEKVYFDHGTVLRQLGQG